VTYTRRIFLAQTATAAAQTAGPVVRIDPKPLFDISPHLYMQFMEPLGVTDGSVEAAWDYDAGDWRKDFVDLTADLAPQVMRWGGLYSRYYKWREGVGPAGKRPPHRNYVWGGKETNRIGTHEFADLCRRVGAEPLMCVNFLSDGEKRYGAAAEGNRTGDAREAADWVTYANESGNKVKLWQLGNETSYGNQTFTKDAAIEHTIDFAKAMKDRDRSIELIGWGDHGREGLWAADMAKRAGEHLSYIAIHMMGQSPRRPDSVLRGLRYQHEPERAWEELNELADRVETRVSEVEHALDSIGARQGLAITEGHLSLPPHNANPLLYEWLSAVYHVRSLNIYQRHGARVRIATAADFQGNRWTVNALMLQTPGRLSYLMPVGSIMRLFRKHSGTQGVSATAPTRDLDIAASRTGSTVFLHVLNTNYSRAVEAGFEIASARITGGRVFEIAPKDPREYVGPEQPKIFDPVEKALPAGSRWTFPARSVSVVELQVETA
jgi:hypothetical protein